MAKRRKRPYGRKGPSGPLPVNKRRSDEELLKIATETDGAGLTTPEGARVADLVDAARPKIGGRRASAADFENVAEQMAAARMPSESAALLLRARVAVDRRAEEAENMDAENMDLANAMINGIDVISKVVGRVADVIARQPEPRMEITSEFQADSRAMIAFYLGEARAVEYETHLNAAKASAINGGPKSMQEQLGGNAMRVLSEAFAELHRRPQDTVTVVTEETADELIDRYLGHDEAVRYAKMEDKTEALKIVQAALNQALLKRNTRREEVVRLEGQLNDIQALYARTLDPMHDFRRDEAWALCALASMESLRTGGQS